MADHKRKLLPGKGYDKNTGRAARWHKLSNADLRADILAGLEGGGEVDAVCERSGVTVRQLRYRQEHDPAFKTAYGRAALAGQAVRDMDPERAALFLVACKWLCHVDVAREAVGLDRAALSNVFKHRPEFKREALEAANTGRAFQNDGENGMFRYSTWGRRKLRNLAMEAQAMELLGEIPLNS